MNYLDPEAETAAPVERFGGFTLDELAEYLERDRTPVQPEIESSDEARSALESLNRMRRLTGESLAAESRQHGHLDEPWVLRVLSFIRADAREGRSIPLAHPNPRVKLSVSERALRALIRACGDQIGGVAIGRVIFHGDVETLGAPVSVEVRVALFMFTAVHAVADLLRDHIGETIRRHARLNLTAVDLVFTNVIPGPGTAPAPDRNSPDKPNGDRP